MYVDVFYSMGHIYIYKWRTNQQWEEKLQSNRKKVKSSPKLILTGIPGDLKSHIYAI